MESKIIVVKNLASGLNTSHLRQLFGMYGECEMEYNGESAFVQYRSEAEAAGALQTLHNTKLIGLNPYPVSIQFYPGVTKTEVFPGLQKSRSILNQKESQESLQNRSQSQGKKMQIEKEQKYPQTMMNQNMNTMNMKPSKAMIQNQIPQQDIENYSRGNMGGSDMMKMQMENMKSAQELYDQKFKTMATEYMRSQPHKSKKYAALTKAYFEEFYIDTKSMPKQLNERSFQMSSNFFVNASGVEIETGEREMKPMIDPTTLSYSELQSELRKRNITDVKGSKQTLMYALQRALNEF